MKDLIFSFDEMGSQKDAATKRVVKLFAQASTPIAQGEVTPGTKRTAGVSYREMLLTFVDGQTILLRVKSTGDIFQVMLNGKLTPIKNQTDHAKAVKELVGMLDAGRAKYQKKLSLVRAELPKGIKTAAPKIEEALKQHSDELDTAIAGAREKITELRTELEAA
jgi:hypothetical protein